MGRYIILELVLTVTTMDIAIIGAGPYGLSLAAHLRESKRSVRIFGSPMHSWSHHMPQGMHLKSEGFASNLYDPEAKFTLRRNSPDTAIPTPTSGFPWAAKPFTPSGVDFPDGIVKFAYLPPLLTSIPSPMISHSSQHSDLTEFKGRKVAVLGAGASAVDIAALLHRAGADVELIARTQTIKFHDPPNEPRPLLQRLRAPRSGLGTGWRSRLCTDIPLVFHATPQSLRIKAVARHLGPAPARFVRDAVADRVPMHLGVTLAGAYAHEGRARLVLRQSGGEDRQVEFDHIIAATGYKAAVSRLTFIDESVQSRLRKAEEAPILNRHFESSVSGLYFVGAAAGNSFGPLFRFAFGAKFAAERVAARLATA